MAGEHVTRGEFDSQLILVHETIKNSNERNDIKHNALLERLDTVAEQNRAVLSIITNELDTLKTHKTKTEIYWKIAIFFASSSWLAILGRVGWLIFSGQPNT